MSGVKVYSTPQCPYCVKAKDFLKSKSVEFEDIDVSQDRTRAFEMMSKSGQAGVPVLDIKGEIIVGFDRPAIESALGM